MTKITKREMYMAIADTMRTGECKFPPEDVIAFCEREIDTLDRKAARAKEKAAERAVASDAITEGLFSVLSDDAYMTTKEIIAAYGDEDMTSQKVAARMRKLIDADRVEKSEVSVEDSEGKSTKKVAYRKIAD